MHIKFNLTKKVLAWYDNNKRSLPWRVGKKSTNLLYYRLLSEFMLQQTQVKTAIPYFEKFTKRFPSLNLLSKTNEKNVLKMWEGLGYYRRARNLLATSKILVNKYNSKLPREVDEIKTLPGVGDYTSNVLAALIYNKPTLALDGNVKRVISRILNTEVNKIDFKSFKNINKKKIFNTNRNSELVEAMMEFGSLICNSKIPKCGICPIKKNCKFYKSKNKIKQIKKKVTNESINIFCYLSKKGEIALTKKNNLGFLNKFNLPKIESIESSKSFKNWKLLSKYKNSISNKRLNINLYYQFSKYIPNNYSWYSIKINNNEFMPSFTKKILKQVSVLF
ncbi:A/G-specific adenine glycosylase [Pelagibacteraceae bacterium]|nr:A/G-specific adenine glycosylase [Pelagibacteraceae bacterium]